MSQVLDEVCPPKAITAGGTGPKFRLRSCGRCGGDAFLDRADGGEWRCLQCARPVTVDGGTNDHRELVHSGTAHEARLRVGATERRR